MKLKWKMVYPEGSTEGLRADTTHRFSIVMEKAAKYHLYDRKGVEDSGNLAPEDKMVFAGKLKECQNFAQGIIDKELEGRHLQLTVVFREWSEKDWIFSISGLIHLEKHGFKSKEEATREGLQELNEITANLLADYPEPEPVPEMTPAEHVTEELQKAEEKQNPPEMTSKEAFEEVKKYV